MPQHNPLSSLYQDSAPLVVRQHVQPPKKYVVLTSQGVYIFCKQRPVDVLRQLLSDSRGLDSETVKAYFVIQKEDQACAASLIIASLGVDENQELAEYATRAFFMFGGEPKLAVTNQSHTRKSNLFVNVFLDGFGKIWTCLKT